VISCPAAPYNVFVKEWLSIGRRWLIVFGVAAGLLAVQGCASGRRGVESSVIPRGWPVPYDVARISSAFGAPRGSSRHKGLDLTAPKGTKVRTTADGRVTFAGRSGDFGRLVVVEHEDGYETRYAHLKSIEVKKGRKLKRGAVVGTVGKSGNATGFHLHYEVRLQGTPVNPRSYL
jgi:murein DD-endopeptidase MepM/ murein hydrolase activator NlpD